MSVHIFKLKDGSLSFNVSMKVKIMKQAKNYYLYKGVIIWRNTRPGHYLKYNAIGYGAADTLKGMKELIKGKD